MHIHEDAVIIEICDAENAQPVAPGERGNIFITSLYKYSAPQIRFNVNDVSAIKPGQCACGSTLARLDKIFGRADNMIKLRGVNVFPEAVGALVAEDVRCTGEYFCLVERAGAAGREEMTVMVELKGGDGGRVCNRASTAASRKASASNASCARSRAAVSMPIPAWRRLQK